MPVRQIKNKSTSASPSNAAGPGQHDNRAELPQPLAQANFVVDVVANLLSGRADAAAILAAVASRIAPPSEPSYARSPQQPDKQPDMQPSSANASPPTVKVLGERTHAQRDAELRKDAFDLASISSSVTSGPSSYTPTVKQSDTCSPVLLTAAIVPDALKTSPSYAVVQQVLRAPVDFTTKDWRVRNFYDQADRRTTCEAP